MSGKFGAEFVQLRRISKDFPRKAIGLFGLYEKLKNQKVMTQTQMECFVFGNQEVNKLLR